VQLMGGDDMQTINQLTEQEQVLISAFRNLHPERKNIHVAAVVRGAMDQLKNGPSLALVRSTPPQAVG
jgi:hypothetical protein